VQLSEVRQSPLTFDEGLWALDAAPLPAKNRCLMFLAGDQPVAVPIHSLRDVLLLESIMPLPGVPPWVLGLTNVRGTVVGVVDLAWFLGRGRLDARGGRLVVCYAGPRTVALAVADARRIVDYAPLDLAPVSGVTGRIGRYVRSVVPVDGALVPLLDIDELLAEDELVKG
jgi:purine-binding chemotaxis protein CheW